MEEFSVKILLVDDHEENLLSLESVLLDDAYQLVKATSGKEALRILLKDTDFTLILMDVVMPDMDGFETAGMIYEREKLRNIPIIFLTAKEEEDNIFKAYNLGAVDYIRKPIIPELLKAKVEVFVELSRKNQLLKKQKLRLKKINESLQREVQVRKLNEAQVKKLNSELHQRLEELESLDAFTSSVSHDLKTPLTSIYAMTQLLIQRYAKELDHQGKDMLEKIKKDTKELSDLITHLLLFSRAEKEGVKKEPVDMRKIVEEVTEEVLAKSQVKKRPRVDIENLPSANCDSTLIKQVWVNLIGNAIKYSSKSQSPEVKITGMVQNGHVVYTVQDNGVGFDSTEVQHLFKVFKRLNTSKDFDGTGVGLAIVKKIVEHHGGTIWADANPGSGAKFSFTL